MGNECYSMRSHKCRMREYFQISKDLKTGSCRKTLPKLFTINRIENGQPVVSFETVFPPIDADEGWCGEGKLRADYEKH